MAHPSHYSDPGIGVSCIQVAQAFNFNRGNAIKYIWRAGKKHPELEIEDLEKARQYLAFEIARLKAGQADTCSCESFCCRELPPHDHPSGPNHQFYRELR